MSAFEKTASKKSQPALHRTQDYFAKIVASFLWAPKLPIYPQYLFLWISNLQYIAILLWAQLAPLPLQQDTFSRVVLKICKAMVMKDLISPGDNSLMSCAYFYFLALCIMVILLIVKIIRKGAISGAERLLIFLISQFHLTVGFWSLNNLLLDGLMANERFQASFFGLSFHDTLLITVHIALLVLNYAITLLFSLYSYDPFKDSNELAMHTPIFQVLTFISKGVNIGIIVLDLDIEVSLWIFTFFTFSMTLFKHVNFIRTFPYYEFTPLSISLAFSSVSLLMSGISCLSLILQSFISISGMTIIYVQLFLIIFVIKHQKSYLNSYIETILGFEASKSKSQDIVLKKVFALNYILSKTKVHLSKKENYGIKNLLFWGIWPRLIKNSYSGNVLDQRIDSISGVCYDEAIEGKIYQLLKEAVHTLKPCSKLKMFLANYIVQKNINIAVGYNYLQQVMSGNYASKIIASRLLEIYQEKVHEALGEVTDVKAFIEFENMSTTFLEKIYSNSIQFVEFWKVYYKPNLAIMDLLRRSRKIEKEDTLIKSFWLNFKEKDRFFSNSLRLIYSFYLSLVRNAIYSASKLQEAVQFEYFQEEKNGSEKDLSLTVNTLASAENIMIHVSMSKEKVGKIVNLSSNIADKLGWNKSELVGENVNALIPQFMKEKHSRVIIDQLEKDGEISKINRQTKSYVRDRFGYILPCHVYLCLHPDLQREFMYLSVLRVHRLFNEQIILCQDGYIQGFTRNIGQKLRLPVNEKKNIREICTNFGNLGFLGERSKKIETRMESETSGGEQNEQVAVQGKEGVILKLKLSHKVNPYRATISSYTCFDQMFYVLMFNARDFTLDRKISKKGISNGTSKVHNSRTTADCEEDDRKKDMQEEKLNKDEESDGFNIPSEMPFNRIDSHFARVPTPVDSGLQHIENQETNIQIQFPSMVNSRFVKEDKNKEIRDGPDRGPLKNSPSQFAKGFLTKKLTKERILKKDNKPIVGEESVSSSSLRGSSTSLKVEQAIYHVPKDYRMRVLSIFFILFVTLTASILIVFQSKNTQVMQQVTENVLIVGNSVSGLIRILNLVGVCVYYPLLDSGSIFDNRFAFLGLPAVRLLNIPRLDLVSSDLFNFSTKVRLLTSQLDEKLRQNLHTKFPVIDFYDTGVPTVTRQLNSFDLIREFRVEAKKLSKMPAFSIKGNDTKVSFILKNSLDELLIRCEDGINVIMQDTLVKIADMNSTLAMLTCLTGVCSILLLGLSADTARAAISERRKILNIFRRLDEKELMLHTNTVQKFCSLLSKYNMDVRTLSLKIDKNTFANETFLAKQWHINREKPAHMKGINIEITLILVYILLLILVVGFGYVLTILIMSDQNDIINKKIGMMVSANFGLYYTYLRQVAINIYINQPENSTLRSKPFSEEWNRISNYLAGMDSLYLNLVDKEQGFGEDPILVQLFIGDICFIAGTVEARAAPAVCDLLISGVTRRGLIALLTFIRDMNEGMKRTFDNSQKSRGDVISVLNNRDFIQTQMVVPGYLLNAYDMVNTRMQDQLSKDASKSTDTIRVVVIVCLGVYVTLVMLSWWKTRKLMIEETTKWRKIFRIVPETLIRSNKMLEAYLFSAREGKTYFDEAK